MPPTKKKKTKPNDKCPCGSGKKHKKCCMIAGKLASSVVVAAVAAPTTTDLDEMMEALTLTATTTTTAAAASGIIVPCFHGSTTDHFPDGRAYSDVIREYLSEEKVRRGRAKFEDGHMEYFTDSNFSRYIFALCTSWYLKTIQSTEDMNDLLQGAMKIKYVYTNFDGRTFDPDQLKRYVRAICNNTDRDIINCLSRETKVYCDCMKDKKTEADGMEKIAWCAGCTNYFPREGMLICSGCNYTLFCDQNCYDKHWPKHREGCKSVTKTKAMLRETQRKMEEITEVYHRGCGGRGGHTGMPDMNDPNVQNMMTQMTSNPEALSAALQNPMMQQRLRDDPNITPMMRQQMERLSTNPAMIQQMASQMQNLTVQAQLRQAMTHNNGTAITGAEGNGGAAQQHSSDNNSS